ncbi:noggin-2-like [Centruroides sculpturatus]|uniref:noggin-2-like n=1 Tax=Centruroides sculpturatus TaxID=218467 RepID=UPI000C6E7035|nr:noggin-2-like [Centruroides sculpturatus]
MKANLSSSDTTRKRFDMKWFLMVTMVILPVISASDRQKFDQEFNKKWLKLPSGEKLIRRERSDFGDGEQHVFTRFGKKPKKKHLDRDYLMQIMGNSYDADRLSEEEPSVLTGASPIPRLDQVTASSSWTLQRVYRELMDLNLTAEIPKSNADDVTLNVMKQWLFRKAICPVRFAWKDIGPYFWPRWLKIGECDDGKSACSWPSGMHCVAAETSTVQVLRWHCSSFGNKGKKHRSSLKKSSSSGSSRNKKNWKKTVDGDRKCQWIKVPYPVINACTCQC